MTPEEFRQEIPTNPRFSDKVELNERYLGFITVISFSDSSLWITQDQLTQAGKLFLSKENALKIADEIQKRFKDK
jgi:hypothetical protein